MNECQKLHGRKGGSPPLTTRTAPDRTGWITSHKGQRASLPGRATANLPYPTTRTRQRRRKVQALLQANRDSRHYCQSGSPLTGPVPTSPVLRTQQGAVASHEPSIPGTLTYPPTQRLTGNQRQPGDRGGILLGTSSQIRHITYRAEQPNFRRTAVKSPTPSQGTGDNTSLQTMLHI